MVHRDDYHAHLRDPDRQFLDGGFVQQHVLRADGANGASISLRVCIVIKIDDDGRIAMVDENFDPADMAHFCNGDAATVVASAACPSRP